MNTASAREDKVKDISKKDDFTLGYVVKKRSIEELAKQFKLPVDSLVYLPVVERLVLRDLRGGVSVDIEKSIAVDRKMFKSSVLQYNDPEKLIYILNREGVGRNSGWKKYLTNKDMFPRDGMFIMSAFSDVDVHIFVTLNAKEKCLKQYIKDEVSKFKRVIDLQDKEIGFIGKRCLYKNYLDNFSSSIEDLDKEGIDESLMNDKELELIEYYRKGIDKNLIEDIRMFHDRPLNIVRQNNDNIKKYGDECSLENKDELTFYVFTTSPIKETIDKLSDLQYEEKNKKDKVEETSVAEKEWDTVHELVKFKVDEIAEPVTMTVGEFIKYSVFSSNKLELDKAVDRILNFAI